ncbi:hypothetical protein Tco_0181618, partial [Tanacetum coccineum]
MLSVKKANRGSCGLREVGLPGEGHPPEQPEEWESRKEQRKSHKHDKGSLTDELTFPAIPQNRLTDEPIILEGRIEDHQSSADRFLRRNIPPFGSNRPSSNYGIGRKEHNDANGVCNSKISFTIQRHNRKDQNEKPRS